MSKRNLSHATFASIPPWCYLAAMVLLAWWPTLIERPLAGDDYSHAALVGGHLSSYWERFGIWHLFGHCFPFLARELLPRGDALLALATLLSCSVWIHTSTSAAHYYEDLANSLPEADLEASLGDRNPYLKWPNFKRFCGFHFDRGWVTDTAVGYFRIQLDQGAD